MAVVSTSDLKDGVGVVGTFVLALLFAMMVCNNVTAEMKEEVIFSMAEFGEGGGGGILLFFYV